MGVSIQFHATPAENIAFCVEVQRKFDVFVYGLNLQPFAVLSIGDVSATDLLQYRRIVFSTSPVTNTHASKDFHDGSRGALMLEIGPLTTEGLKESWLTSMAAGDTEKLWRRVVKLMKDQTEAGAYAVNPRTGARGFVRNHRFSKAAKELAASGVAMLPVAGSAIYQFDDEDA